MIVSSYANVSLRHFSTTVYLVGKKNAAEPWVSEGCKEYEKRLQSTFAVSTVFLKSDDALVAAGASAKGPVYALDCIGKEYTSEHFAEVMPLVDKYKTGESIRGQRPAGMP